ncbi:MAG: glycosyltransferase family 2 protein [Candidatus Sericytochromatia bacterium]
MTASPRVSVLIRSKNAAETFAETLKSLFTQDFSDFELIVADSGSQDQTLTWLQAWPHRLITVAPEAYYPGKVLNQLARQARGEVLVLLNSDVVLLHAQVLSELLAAFDDPEVMASFGRQLPRPDAEGWVRREYARAFPAAGAPPSWMQWSLPLAAMRRSAWEQMPFYTWAWGSEDTEWGQRARARGWQVAYCPEASVMHSHNYTLKQLYGRRFIEGEADAWMQQQGYPLWKLPLRIVADSLRDLRQGTLRERLQSVPRRAVFHWAHLQGWRHGQRRLHSGSSDGSHGQRTVLARHPAA